VPQETKSQPVTYADAGVDIERADRAKERIKFLAQKTFNRNVLSGIGGFGALFRLDLQRWKNPILVSSADGVGTKLKIAFELGLHQTVGADLVNHCVNDIAVQGATPLFFLDYFATGKLDARVAAEVVSGIARGCKFNGCSLIGGETAEMPGFYPDKEYDLAGFIVGAVERKRMITGQSIREGDVLLGLPSTGLHTNGYSLARKLLPVANRETTEELLQLHRSYLKPLRKLHDADLLLGAAHITGGGITENTPRILPKGLGARIDVGSWPVLPIFELLRKLGDIPEDDWRRTFNLGIGMIVVVRDAKKSKKLLDKLEEPWYQIGAVIRGRGVKYK
jgi:phosphoribosylformylglycinamidine cyclo-ligase